MHGLGELSSLRSNDAAEAENRQHVTASHLGSLPELPARTCMCPQPNGGPRRVRTVCTAERSVQPSVSLFSTGVGEGGLCTRREPAVHRQGEGAGRGHAYPCWLTGG